VIDVNLKGQFIVTQVGGPLLAQSSPSAIVNLSTVEAEVLVSSSGFAQPHYNASKGGVKMLTKACAVELTDVRRPIEWTAVPYFLWTNRGPGWMSVWLPLDA